MKFIIGIIATVFIYILVSASNRTFNLFNFTDATLYIFGSFTFIIWIVIGMFAYLTSQKNPLEKL